MKNSTSIIKSVILSAVAGLATAPSANAVVAKPGLIEARQPDGTTVTIRLEGSYGNHRAYTSDGYLLTSDEKGFYVFAGSNADGMPVATDIKAANPENRTPEMKKAIAALDQSLITDAFANRAAAKAREDKARRIHKGPGLFSTHFPSSGEQHALAILVNFSNKEFSMEDPNDYYTRQLNEEGFSDNGATGSARDYFIDNSYGNFLPTFDVYGPVTLGHPVSYYGSNDAYGNDKRAAEMVVEACRLLDEEIDFSEYDRNGDGVIDNVYVYYAGYGEADGGGQNTIWPHSYDIMSAYPNEDIVLDGVILNHYACSNEVDHVLEIPTGIGTFTHEFSHVMGLPDLYATDNSGAFTPDEWDILDVGSYNNNSCTPPNYSSFERYALDWMEPEVLDSPADCSLDPLPLSNKAYLIPTDKENEYFLLENRQHIGNDRFIPGHGMLVWHVDFVQQIWDYNIVNNNNRHQYVDLVEADNKKTVSTRSGDSFPGTAGITSFGIDTKPALKSWSGVSPGIDLSDIAESEDGVITFKAIVAGSGIEDVAAADGDGIIVDGRSVSCGTGVAVIYDLSGKRVAEAASTPVSVEPGLYIVTSNAGTRKIAIK